MGKLWLTFQTTYLWVLYYHSNILGNFVLQPEHLTEDFETNGGNLEELGESVC